MKLLQLFNDKKFFKAAFGLAIPIIIQNFILSSLNLVDNIIIGGLGETAIAGVGLANQYFFLLDLALFGTASGASIFTAQYWGKRDTKNIKRVLGICLITTIILSGIFTIGALAFPNIIIGFFSQDKNVISLGANYLRIICFSYIVTGISFAYSIILRTVGQVKIPMIVSGTALAINTFLNFSLVYGIGSFHGIGVYGSAIATLIARFIEFFLMLLAIYKLKLPIAAKLHELLDLSTTFVKRFFKVAVPVMLNESMWGLGVTAYAAVYAHMGTAVIAATNITSTIDRLSMVVFFGFGNAAAIMIGNRIGQKDEKTAFLYAKRFIILSPFIGIFMGIILYTSSPAILYAYNINSQVHMYSKEILHIIGMFLWIKIFNYTNVVGILRSGGDTKFCLMLDMGGMWLVGVPFVALTGIYFKLPIGIVYYFVFMEEFVKLLVGLPRLLSKKWINNLVSKPSEVSI
ncbi:putative MATE family efflux protein [Clostridium acetobutylicum]|uniref:Probable cation efflux pump (Multidrug resistance protein) n=1 Tax=Clostridium acetobutylicum (strain ATCC 824 / DSM 792 / JCM 1419 / IAM 19013 / LMG 5710 / NBRC 13948 / NRRL B-527 / VKM B-1787 / 2291 / W) TaxID=272562 RepID=Q97KS0_CLOAB|nr:MULTISPECIES: MATE family efflux transporter [Clostridium]AAK78823.1 Probable cation efflux pump (multidrug resistance protein) [Clostridium acetobutylicum ATCC 824]ADZ19898.1 putative cation efflux pump (multidrug resistance protein) [Clostridium acetobutylicum EA 2018]AEI34083.1 cation efflux pump (multidrug resistance protein) [Clostridium acetobutylicum DSM 1731]AWV80542.1 MATE family efflux transporter [Clostridium acetobutylicum]MBC2392732.1 MATE family efflux transporter [Clostridium